VVNGREAHRPYLVYLLSRYSNGYSRYRLLGPKADLYPYIDRNEEEPSYYEGLAPWRLGSRLLILIGFLLDNN